MPGKRTVLAIALAVVVMAISLASLARAADETIILTVGTEGTTVMLERPFKTVLIGDPNIVDVLTQGDRSALLQPQGLGGTNIIFLDEGNIAIANIRVVVCETAARSTSLNDQSACGEHVDVKAKSRT